MNWISLLRLSSPTSFSLTDTDSDIFSGEPEDGKNPAAAVGAAIAGGGVDKVRIAQHVTCQADIARHSN